MIHTKSTCTKRLRKALGLTLTAILISTLLLPFNLTTAYAEPTSAEKQAEVDEASAKLAAAEDEMRKMGEEYQAAVEAHNTAVAGMEEAQGRIDAAQAIISDTQARLGARAAQMYRDGPLSYLDVLFGASSFEEFTTSWDLINTINQENAELIKANKEARAEAEEAHAEYTAQEVAAAEREKEAEAVKVRAEELVAEQSALVSSLEAEVAELVQKEQEARLAAEAAAAISQIENNGGGGGGYIDGGGGGGQPVPAGGYSDVVAAAASRIGCPYVWGATGPNYFDCSGLTSWSYQQAGRGWIGRTDGDQYGRAAYRTPYSSGEALPGDVLWWPNHVAIYAGGGSYIHAPQPGQSVCYSSYNISNATVLRF